MCTFTLYVVYFAVGISIAFSQTCLFCSGTAKCCAKRMKIIIAYIGYLQKNKNKKKHYNVN